MSDLIVLQRFNIGGRNIELHGYGYEHRTLLRQQGESLDDYVDRWEVRDVYESGWHNTLLVTGSKPTEQMIETAVAADTQRYTVPIIAILVVVILALLFIF